MISALKTAFNLNNLKRPKITKILQICMRCFVNFDPVSQSKFFKKLLSFSVRTYFPLERIFTLHNRAFHSP